MAKPGGVKVLLFPFCLVQLCRGQRLLNAEDGDEAIACLFNLSGEPRFVDAPELAGATLLEVRAGDADLRGGSIGLSEWAAAFLRL